MKQDIEFKIRALVAILRQNGVKVWVDFRRHNKSSLVGVYGELCDKFRQEYTPELFNLDTVQLKWLQTMKVI